MANSSEPPVNPYTGKFDIADEFNTLCLKVEEENFFVSPQFLASQSPVFRVMLLGKNNEYVEGKSSVINFPEKKAQEIKTLLKVLYHYEEVGDETVNLLLKFADEYDFRQVRDRCAEYLAKFWAKSKEKCLEALALAYQYKMPNVAKAALPFCCEKTCEETKPYAARLPTLAVISMWDRQEKAGGPWARVKNEFCNCQKPGTYQCDFCFMYFCKKCINGHRSYSFVKCCRCEIKFRNCSCRNPRKPIEMDKILAEFL